MSNSSNITCVGIVNLDILSFQSMEQATEYVLDGGKVRNEFAIAINAEKVIKAIESKEIMALLSSATMRYADGISIVWAMNKKGVQAVRIPGCELWSSLMDKCVDYNTRVFIVGASPDVSAKVSEKLINKGVNLVGTVDGYFDDENELINKIVQAKPQVISIAMGSPRQEVLIKKCRDVYPEAFYMGVGGTYDVYVGSVKRAPSWLQNINMEWAYRLYKQPFRIFRQSNLFKFFWLYLTNKL